MKPLELEFIGRKRGGEHTAFKYKQVTREGPFAIYERQLVSEVAPAHYELIRVLSHNGRSIAGTLVPAAEYYPSSEQWGVHGWGPFYTKDKAIACMALKLKEENTIMEQPDINQTAPVADTQNTVTTAVKRRGPKRKAVTITWPQGEFKLKPVADAHNVSVPFLHLRVKEAGTKLVFLRAEKTAGVRGKPSGVYRLADAVV